jgi:hypothetical protein
MEFRFSCTAFCEGAHSTVSLVYLLVIYLFAVLGIELRASCVLGRCSTT